MIFVDTNVFMYAVGRPHPLQADALQFFDETARSAEPLCTSAEVLQELLNAYVARGNSSLFDDSLDLVHSFNVEIWPLQANDTLSGRDLIGQYPSLTARDLCHLAVSQRSGATSIKTFDNDLAAAAVALLT